MERLLYFFILVVMALAIVVPTFLLMISYGYLAAGLHLLAWFMVMTVTTR